MSPYLFDSLDGDLDGFVADSHLVIEIGETIEDIVLLADLKGQLDRENRVLLQVL